MTPPTAPERCTVCDRPLAVGGCPRFRASSATSWTAHEWKSAAFDCHAHRVDWRARALAAEADATRWRKVAPLIANLHRAALIGASHTELIAAVAEVTAATQEPTP